MRTNETAVNAITATKKMLKSRSSCGCTSAEAADRLLLRLRELEDRREAEEVEDLLHVRGRVQEDDVASHVLGSPDRPDENARAGGRDVVELLQLDDEPEAILAEQGLDETLHLLE